MDFPSDSGESVCQRIVATAWVMRHRRIPVTPGSAVTGPHPLPAPAIWADRQGRRWEVHHDPYDLSHVFVRNYRNRGWLSAAWTHLPMVGAPFTGFTWRAGREIVAQRGGATPRSSAPGQPDHLGGKRS
jgi:hypothetical protein